MTRPEIDATVIGKNLFIRGEVTGTGNLLVDGKLEGTVHLREGLLTIGPSAQVVADLDAQDMMVHGAVQGTLRAEGRVDLRQTAAVHGDIEAPRLSIEENATVKGRIALSGEAS